MQKKPLNVSLSLGRCTVALRETETDFYCEREREREEGGIEEKMGAYFFFCLLETDCHLERLDMRRIVAKQRRISYLAALVLLLG